MVCHPVKAMAEGTVADAVEGAPETQAVEDGWARFSPAKHSFFSVVVLELFEQILDTKGVKCESSLDERGNKQLVKVYHVFKCSLTWPFGRRL